MVLIVFKEFKGILNKYYHKWYPALGGDELVKI